MDVGRRIGMRVMTTGVGVFATFAGYITHKLLAPSGNEQVKKERVQSGPPSAEVTIAELKQYIKERERIDAEISSRLETLERLTAREVKPHDS